MKRVIFCLVVTLLFCASPALASRKPGINYGRSQQGVGKQGNSGHAKGGQQQGEERPTR
jgi:hypothetical protein